MLLMPSQTARCFPISSHSTDGGFGGVEVALQQIEVPKQTERIVGGLYDTRGMSESFAPPVDSQTTSLRMQPGSRSGRASREECLEDSDVIRAYAAFLIALDADGSVAIDEGFGQHLDAVSQAIGFL
ncbi:MAG: hypothetical protein AAFV36_01415 [Myxococcota bacterium]